MDSTASFHWATEGYYIIMLPADWLLPTSHDTLPSSFYGERCYGILLCNSASPGAHNINGVTTVTELLSLFADHIFCSLHS